MLNNYLLLALRHLFKHKMHSALMILGLAIGLAASAVILILNYIEQSYDKHWPDMEHIYQLESVIGMQDGYKLSASTGAPDQAYYAIKNNITEISYISRKRDKDTKITVHTGKTPTIFQERASLVDNDFFLIFKPEVLQGNLNDFYQDESSIIISDELATKLFDKQPALGKVISLDATGFKTLYVKAGDNTQTTLLKDFKIVAIVKIPARRSSLGPHQLFVHAQPDEILKDTFAYSPIPIYLKLKAGAVPQTIEEKLPTILDSHMSLPEFVKHKPSEIVSISLLPIKAAHRAFQEKNGHKDNTVILYGLAIIIMLMACINYINLALAAHTNRQKEVALRKAMGAEQKNIAQQFMFESLLTTGIAFLLAIALVELCIPWLKQVFLLEIDSKELYDPLLLGYLLAAALAVGVASGAYPSIYLARLNPAATLKSNKSRETSRSIYFRQALVIIQFVISGVLMSCTLITFAQTRHLQHYQPGYQTHHILFITQESMSTNKLETITNAKNRVARMKNVEAVSFAMPGLIILQRQQGFNRAGNPPEKAAHIDIVNLAAPDELQTLNIKLLAGNYFLPASIDNLFSQRNQQKIYINAQALTPLGFNSPEEAINQQLEVNELGSKQVYTIVAVTEAVHVGRLNTSPKPVVFWPISEQALPVSMMVRYSDANKTIAEDIKKLWQDSFGYTPYTWRIEDAIADEYKDENLITKFIYLFTGVALFISGLGFYGLAAHSTARRTKEIGLRKIHGAGEFTIVKHLLWQFSRPVLFANLFIWPIGFYAINRWLEQFVDRIDILLWAPGTLLAASLAAVFIAWLTVGGHAYVVARARPADSLREE